MSAAVVVTVLLSLVGLLWPAVAIEVRSIDSYGAVANVNSVEAAVTNSHAIAKALLEAPTGSAVLVPANSKYYVFSASASGLKHVQLWIEGELIAQSNITAWPTDGKNYLSVLSLQNCVDFVLTGKSKGSIKGQGFRWWVEFLFNFLPFTRPHLVAMENCEEVLVENLQLRNSPRYHMHLQNMTNLVVRNVDIWVNVSAQETLVKSGRGYQGYNLPMFPFNTDGIDPSGRNILIQNITVENYDDAVAVKPGNVQDGCTENVTVENSRVIRGVGMSIGSVPPNVKINCIRNVRFRNIEFSNPFKAIYVKTNSGNEGFGIIDDIWYQNITIHSPILWPIYIGPQQQKEPDGSGDGIWPPTQPRVNVTNIHLQNVTSDGGWLNAGVLRCNVTNPCTGITFDHVTVTGWLSSFYTCENVHGSVISSTPIPSCMETRKIDHWKHAV